MCHMIDKITEHEEKIKCLDEALTSQIALVDSLIRSTQSEINRLEKLIHANIVVIKPFIDESIVAHERGVYHND